MEPTNPAARLHAIISSAYASLGQPNTASAAISLWSRVFEINETKSPNTPEHIEVISRLLQLRRLVDETEERLRSIEGLPDKYFGPFPRIRALPDQSLNGLNTDISLTIRAITESDMVVLDFCSDKLEEWHAEPIVNEVELQEILKEVSVLFDEVKTGNLDPELQTFILDGLESIRRGIYEYRIRGPQRLKEVLAEIIGSLAMNRDIVRAAGDSETVGRFEKTFYRLAAAVSFAKDGVALLSAVKVALLPSGG